MKYYKIDPYKPDPAILKETAHTLEAGGIIVYPTDTLYGLGVDAYNKKAVSRLFTIKNRSLNKPVSLMMPHLQLIREIFGIEPPDRVDDLKKMLPGPVTALIANRYQKKIPAIEKMDQPGTFQEKVGVRIPDHPFCRELTHIYDSPITSTSANLSGKANPLEVSEIIGQLGAKVDMIIDAGPLTPSKGSTIIDLTRDPYLILREGDWSRQQLQSLLDKPVVSRDERFIITFVCSGNICRSPMGMGILHQMLERTKYRPIIRVQSAGTLDVERQMTHPLALEVSAQNGIDLQGHFSQHINEKIIVESQLVICMAQNHINYLHRRYPNHKHKIVLLKQWKRKEELAIPSVADPIGHSASFFKETYKEIHKEIKRIFPGILAEVRRFANERDLTF